MFSSPSKKISAALLIAFVAVASIFVVSCQKELSGSGFTITETPPDLTTKISSTITGFVTDETDAVVQGAIVQAGTATTTTDKYGYFEIRNIQVVKNAAVVTVIKPGYFKGIKTYIAAQGKNAFFRIKLLPKTIAGSFDAAAGGSVSLANGLSISFPANVLKVVGSNAAYTGQVTVSAQWYNPQAADLNRTMPGDLRGLDSLGFMKVLTTFGMSATELTGASGETLQINPAVGNATISFPIPAAMNAAAPASIPLWHFDETNGLWRQQGHASKSGSTYVGEVSHFSWWNCDLPNASVPLSFTVVNSTGTPISNVYVNIVPTTPNSWSHAGGYTDSSGFVNVLVTPDAQYQLSVWGECNNTAYTQNFSVGTTAVNLGNITVTGSSTVNVNGTVECSGSPLSDAYVVMTSGYLNYRYPVNSDGTYSFTTTVCNSSSPVTFIAENLSTMQSGDPVSFTLSAGNNTVPALGACVNNIDQFINYSVNGTNYTISAPTDSLMEELNQQAVPPIMYVSGYTAGGGQLVNSANFSLTAGSIVAGGSQTLQSFYARQIVDSSTNITSPIAVNITEYGAVGEFIAGNFSGTLTGSAPANNTYTITCTFRVRRRL